MFSFSEQHAQGPGLDLTYHLAPWDHPIFQGNTATVTSFHLQTAGDPEPTYTEFLNWCARNRVLLVSCRLAQSQIKECSFLEARGFHFVELNYRPILNKLDGFSYDAEILISEATDSDKTEICQIAGQVFSAGRLHVDPQVGPEIGNRRYAAWAANAFRNPTQRVLKCMIENRIVAFLVVETPTPTTRFWSLTALAPGLVGQGLGRRVWQAMLARHRDENVVEVSTSISSHNVEVHNLYVSLGFRFPAPKITLHWCPYGPVKPQ